MEVKADHTAPLAGHGLNLGEDSLIAHLWDNRILGESQREGSGGSGKGERGANARESGINIKGCAGRIGEATRNDLGGTNHTDLGRSGDAVGQGNELGTQSGLIQTDRKGQTDRLPGTQSHTRLAEEIFDRHRSPDCLRVNRQRHIINPQIKRRRCDSERSDEALAGGTNVQTCHINPCDPRSCGEDRDKCGRRDRGRGDGRNNRRARDNSSVGRWTTGDEQK